ncbi:MAG: excinuclease ABC subunit UvrA, partial [Patescibacteria group bacterium]
MDKLIIHGARVHNLKNISLTLPKNQLIVFTGLSGSGKSSLAFDTIYAEGQRRYVESLSSYARQFLGIMDKPDVETIEGLSPAIAIDQKTTSHNPRSTVGTVTEIYDYLRLLFARVGHPHCPNCGREIAKLAPSQIFKMILQLAQGQLTMHGQKFFRFLILAPVVRDRKGEFSGLFENLRAKGYREIRVDGRFINLNEDLYLIKTNKHTIEVVIDKFSLERKQLKGESEKTLRARLAEAIEQALVLADGLVILARVDDPGFQLPEKPKKVTDFIYSQKFACPACQLALPEIEPRTFSFNSPHGACPVCSGIGSVLTVNENLVINPELSITEGGILPFAKMFFHDTWFARVITTLARKSGIDPRARLANLTPKQKQILLYGTGETVHEVTGTNRFGEMTTIYETYPGVIPELKRRYAESNSEYVRGEIEKYMRREVCQACSGTRLKRESLTITIDGLSIADVVSLSIRDAQEWVKILGGGDTSPLAAQERVIAAPILKEIANRLRFLTSVGLDYLTLGRSALTLAGGEAQRIRLASQIGSGLSGVLYVLDEPSIGLHPRDNRKLINTLRQLRDLGNTVIVVEHD